MNNIAHRLSPSLTHFGLSNASYGYRRIHLDVKDTNMPLSEKVIRRLMKEENLVVKSIKKKKYSSYMGEISPAVENVIKRVARHAITVKTIT